MKKKYAFNLGRVYTLSLAELFAVFEKIKLKFKLVDLYREVLIIEVEEKLPAKDLQQRMGGTIKIMEVLDSLSRKKRFKPSQLFKDYFDKEVLEDNYIPSTASSKLIFGVSIYPMSKGLPPLSGENKRVGMEIKNTLKAHDYSVRMIFPQGQALALPSVAVTKEHILDKGAELVFFVAAERIWTGKTLTVQDFEDYGRRDYQRPVRDMEIGMLPPKVAQIMINLAKIPESAKTALDEAVLDPFVGSGTLIQEAILQGFRAVGADISNKSVQNAETNLAWIRNRYSLPPGRFEIVKADATKLPEGLPDNKYQAVITEGTLGPTYSELPTKKEILQNFKELENIYLNAFQAFQNVLQTGMRVVIALPAYRLSEKKYEFFPIVDKITDLGYNLVQPLPKVLFEQFDFLNVTERGGIIYDRKDQFVSREIFIFQLN